PRQNPGGFRAILAFNAAGERDYTSGLNIDLGPAATPRFSVLNAEGRGFGGARNLRTADDPLPRLHTIELPSDAAAKAMRPTVDGRGGGEGGGDAGAVSLGEITVGGRYYSNEPGPQRVQGFGRSDVAEVLVYGRALAAGEAAKVREYLAAKYAGLRDALPPDGN